MFDTAEQSNSNIYDTSLYKYIGLRQASPDRSLCLGTFYTSTSVILFALEHILDLD